MCDEQTYKVTIYLYLRKIKRIFIKNNLVGNALYRNAVLYFYCSYSLAFSMLQSRGWDDRSIFTVGIRCYGNGGSAFLPVIMKKKQLPSLKQVYK